MDRHSDRASQWRSYGWRISALFFACSDLVGSCTAQQPPPDATWVANATLDVERSITDMGLGAIQGVVVRDGKIADYGDVRPEIRLYDPEALLAAGRSSAPRVVVHRVLCGSFNQNLHWDAGSGRIICLQNVIAGRGWRLDGLDLARAVADGRADGPDVRVRWLTFDSHDELEGSWQLSKQRGLFAVARRRDNLFIGTYRQTAVFTSPAVQGKSIIKAVPTEAGPSEVHK